MVICQLFWPLKSLPFPLIYHVIFGFWRSSLFFFLSFFLSFTCLALQKPSLPFIFFSSFSFLVLLGFPCIFFFFLDRPSPAVVTSTSRLFPAPYFFSFCSSQQQQQDRSSRGSRPEQLDSPELRLSGDFRWCRLLVELHSSSKSSILNF